jgi:hypothetical protein
MNKIEKLKLEIMAIQLWFQSFGMPNINEVEIKLIKLSPRIKHLILNKINPYK